MLIHIVHQEENKDIALGTSKLNYLDPRISVSWYGYLATVYINSYDIISLTV